MLDLRALEADEAAPEQVMLGRLRQGVRVLRPRFRADDGNLHLRVLGTIQGADPRRRTQAVSERKERGKGVNWRERSCASCFYFLPNDSNAHGSCSALVPDVPNQGGFDRSTEAVNGRDCEVWESNDSRIRIIHRRGKLSDACREAFEEAEDQARDKIWLNESQTCQSCKHFHQNRELSVYTGWCIKAEDLGFPGTFDVHRDQTCPHWEQEVPVTLETEP